MHEARYTQQEDSSLVTQPPVLTSEELSRVYRDTVASLYAFVSRRTGGDRQLSEDVVQETYLRAVKDWAVNGPPNESLSWLRTVARHLLANFYRREKPQDIDPSRIDRALGQREVDSAETARLLHWALARLRQEDARLIEAFHLDGRSTQDLAEATGLSSKAVEGRLYRARRALHELLLPHLNSTGEDS